MIFEYILKIELSNIFRNDFDDNRVKMSYFRKLIDINKNDVKVIEK